jgi:glycosyltransferase involved in cell wall biosynthesis
MNAFRLTSGIFPEKKPFSLNRDTAAKDMPRLTRRKFMEKSELKIDLHVHCQSSRRPSQWVLQKLNCPESFTNPLTVYKIAKARGMDYVTITDHNTIEGAVEIAHLPDSFIGEEITTYFPEDKCKLHVLALDITESQHAEISCLRKNVYDLAGYLNCSGIVHILAHPFYDMNHKLTIEHFEKLVLMFNNFELNGSRDDYQNQVLAAIIKGITKHDIELLADKHNMKPLGKNPWQKNLTGGSDDHSSLNIARMYTVVRQANTLEAFFHGLENGRAEVRGKAATPKTLGHNLYGIAYQFYKSRFSLERYVHKDTLFQFIECALTIPGENKDKGILTRLQDFLISRRPSVSFGNEKNSGLFDMIQKEGHRLLSKNPRMQWIRKHPRDLEMDRENDWFRFVNDISESIIQNVGDTILDSFQKARFLNILQTIGSAGSVYTLLSPYFLAFRLFTKDRAFAEKCHAHCLSNAPKIKPDKSKIALFTDTLFETNGVANTIRMMLNSAVKNNKSLKVITCRPGQALSEEINFQPTGAYQLPEYPQLKMYYPPVLKIVDYCYQHNFTHVHASTPGPVGLLGLAIAKILQIPFYGTYHTAFPQYVSELTGDEDLAEIMWKLMILFYSQMDLIYVPSGDTGKQLVEKGIPESKICLYPRGIDIQRFHPDKRNGFWKGDYKLSDQGLKLLYVGRISKEKNLGMLVEAFKKIERQVPDARLILVGDGPYRKEMENKLNGFRVLFTGELTGERLARAYASSDLFVFPSATDTFGNVILEAQASGIPVIVTDKGGPRQNIIEEQTGFIVPADDPQALSEVVIELSDNPQKLIRMKKAARSYMENRSFDQAFLQTWELFKKQPGPKTISPKNFSFDHVLDLAS